jgi:hypothetical protein
MNYELRSYTVTSDKMDGVLERFRDTVEPVRRKHGIEDADWIRVEKETEADGKLRSAVTIYKLTPTDFSALK